MTDKSSPVDQKSIEQAEAAEWKSLLESGDISDAARAEYQSWANADIRHTCAMDGINRVVEAIRAPLTLGMTAAAFRSTSDDMPHVAPAIHMAPIAEMAMLTGAHNSVGTERGETGGYFLRDETALRLAPETAVDLHFDGEVRTIMLRRGFVFISRPRDAAGSLLVRIAPAIGGTVRIEPNCALTIEIHDDKAHCHVASGSCVVTVADDDFLVCADESAVFDAAAGECLVDARPHAFAWVEDRLVGGARPLCEAIENLRPYSSLPISFAPALSARPVMGEYRLSTPNATLVGIATEISARLEASDVTLHLAEDALK